MRRSVNLVGENSMYIVHVSYAKRVGENSDGRVNKNSDVEKGGVLKIDSVGERPTHNLISDTASMGSGSYIFSILVQNAMSSGRPKMTKGMRLLVAFVDATGLN